MKTTVVCGLLGSGKTTFIRRYLAGSREKTVVLVNDFGAAGIDGEILSAGGIEAVELPGGCVCCTLKFDLIITIKKIIRDFSPAHLVIEPSGVASPSGALEALESAGLDSATVIGVVDAAEFPELYNSEMYGSFFNDQIACSDVILVNKTDLAQEETIIETLYRIEAINPRAVLLRTVNAELKSSLPEGTGNRGKQKPFSPIHFDTLSVRVSPGVQIDAVQKLISDLAEGTFGNVVRAKALISTDRGPYRFDISFGKVNCVRFEKDIDDSRLVVIGEDLDELTIRTFLEERQALPRLLPG